jgi:hypothetical protein
LHLKPLFFFASFMPLSVSIIASDLAKPKKSPSRVIFGHASSAHRHAASSWHLRDCGACPAVVCLLVLSVLFASSFRGAAVPLRPKFGRNRLFCRFLPVQEDTQTRTQTRHGHSTNGRSWAPHTCRSPVRKPHCTTAGVTRERLWGQHKLHAVLCSASTRTSRSALMNAPNINNPNNPKTPKRNKRTKEY